MAQLLFEVIHVCAVVSAKLKDEGLDTRQCSEVESLQAEICSYAHFLLIEEPAVIQLIHQQVSLSKIERDRLTISRSWTQP